MWKAFADAWGEVERNRDDGGGGRRGARGGMLEEHDAPFLSGDVVDRVTQVYIDATVEVDTYGGAGTTTGGEDGKEKEEGTATD